MKIEDFEAGSFVQRYQYKSFEPTAIDHEWTWDDAALSVSLENAARALGELNAYSSIVPDVDLYIQMHVLKEAQKSSKIEGTQTGIDEALLSEEQVAPERRNDWKEVNNYIRALDKAIARLEAVPLSNRLLRETHSVLMEGVRGEKKSPGTFRVSQNWIGGSNLTDAAFIPPHPEGIAEMMSDLEKFWHNDAIATPHLIRTAISHYQFETIHPFLDGNGRIGRLLIPLYLINFGLLKKPALYLSDFFERNRGSYYDALTRVRESNDLVHWVKFFLSGLIETAERGVGVFTEIMVLKKETEAQIAHMGKRAGSAKRLLDQLFKKPVIQAADIKHILSISTPTANSLIKAFCEADILCEMTGNQRNKIYSFKHYLELFSQ